MYLEHFGLREAPFLITPHTEFFFAGANRGATLEALIYAITHDEGIVKISGEVDSGKTMLCRMLLEKLPPDVVTVYLANPSISRDEILLAIADDLDVSLPSDSPHQRLRALQDRLLEIHASGRKVVVMIDEAHAMPSESLEEIRLLSNLETSRHKLLHIVLFGQPELDVHLSSVGMRQLKERITHNFALEPLHRKDIGNYLMFRIRAAGYRGPDLFTPRAIQLISKASEGLTRRINILADKAMLSAFSENRHQIDARQIKVAIRDTQFGATLDNKPGFPPLALGAVAVLLTAALIFFAEKPGSSTPTPPTETASRPASVKETVHPAAPAARPPSAAEANAAPLISTTAPPTQASAPPLAERITATETWLSNTPDSHYFIQLLSTDGNDFRGVEQFLRSNAATLDLRQIRVYRSSLSGKNRLGVIYGDFDTHEKAAAQLAKLTLTKKTGGPYIRAVSKLR